MSIFIQVTKDSGSPRRINVGLIELFEDYMIRLNSGKEISCIENQRQIAELILKAETRQQDNQKQHRDMDPPNRPAE